MTAKPVTDAEIIALALRELATGLERAMTILAARAPMPTASEKRTAFTDFTGLSRADVLQRMRAHGYDRRAFGSLIRHGYVIKRLDSDLYDGLTGWRESRKP